MSRRAAAEWRGRAGEWLAILYLIAKGYRVLGHRLRTPYGEVDVAAWKSGVLVIVEVKARRTYDAGAYALTPAGQQRIARAAQVLAGRWRLHAAPVRYDLIVVGASWLPKHERGAWFNERLGV
ncbi:MAG TPA: YraN family protein [Terricaulis sp.]|nr:YraN family protein [Terricaulis sp.]HRP09635.1 YraN family protein [Terricaulis sp.]